MKLFENLMMSFQIGLLTGICLTAILGASFGSLATLFSQDPEVLQVVGTGVLVCMILLIYWSLFACLYLCLPQTLVHTVIYDCCQFVSASQPFNALAYIFDGLHYGVSDFPYAAFSMVSCLLVKICCNVSVLVHMFHKVNFVENCFIDGCGSSLLSIFGICAFTFWPSWGMAGLDSLHGSSCGSWFCQVKWHITVASCTCM